mmetsp:Transcript_14739/g.42200  ORF Transcript_14739/g.42200 Transcript_14739/m.42200 type:complete len:286 (+) Transcript_14739:111-968(+)
MGSYRIEVEHRNPQKYFLDIADDGYVITSELELGEGEREELCRELIANNDWTNHGKHPAINKLDECTDESCACSRIKNPHARDLFLASTVARLVDVTAGMKDVSYASLGCGLLKFDFCLVEALLAAGVQLTSVHLVDSMYDVDAKKPEAHRAALAQFSAWCAGRGIDVYAHVSMERFAFRARQSGALPAAALIVDCVELVAVFESEVRPMLEEVLQYGGLFCSLTARGSTVGDGSMASGDAWGEVWRLVPETGRIRQMRKTRYPPSSAKGIEMGEKDALPPVVSH